MALNVHVEELRARHYVYPRVGRPADTPDGHHNIAWEITGDRRFRREYGTIGDLMAETGGAQGDVLISSEDFECSLTRFDGFEAFVRLLQAQPFNVRIIVYFRNQIDYSKSLYATMLNFGIVESFDEFVNRVIDDRQFAWHEWTFPFDYRAMLWSLERLANVEVVARSYDHLKGGSLFEDFFSILGLAPSDLGIESELRAYPRQVLADLIRAFRQNRKGTPLGHIEEQVIRSLWGGVSGRLLDMTSRSKARLAEAFNESNRYLFEKYSLPEFTRMTAAPEFDDSEDVLCLEALFSSAFDDRLSELTKVMDAERRGLAAECKAPSARYDALQSELVRLEREKATTASELDAVRRELQIMLSSKSWRVTAPFRRIRALLG
jgi:hypothetical protein